MTSLFVSGAPGFFKAKGSASYLSDLFLSREKGALEWLIMSITTHGIEFIGMLTRHKIEKIIRSKKATFVLYATPFNSETYGTFNRQQFVLIWLIGCFYHSACLPS